MEGKEEQRYKKDRDSKSKRNREIDRGRERQRKRKRNVRDRKTEEGEKGGDGRERETETCGKDRNEDRYNTKSGGNKFYKSGKIMVVYYLWSICEYYLHHDQ